MKAELFNGMPIVITPGSKIQNRTHKKKRINKKWAKRYGYTDSNVLEDGKIIQFGNMLCMNQKTHESLRKMIGKEIINE